MITQDNKQTAHPQEATGWYAMPSIMLKRSNTFASNNRATPAVSSHDTSGHKITHQLASKTKESARLKFVVSQVKSVVCVHKCVRAKRIQPTEHAPRRFFFFLAASDGAGIGGPTSASSSSPCAAPVGTPPQKSKPPHTLARVCMG